ncbi:MAG: DUF4190 domain-containing protein [Planctomycetes bacterium]|nr:DUF4190 domain-containing protein [Planctomycetota bacterium]
MPGPCINHPTTESARDCAGCRRPFCDDCLIELGGWVYCGACKNAAVAAAVAFVEYTLPREALIWSVVGGFCCGPILAPVGIYKGLEALRKIRDDERLPGKGLAIAAVVIGIGVLVMNVVALIQFFTGVGMGLYGVKR